MKKNNNNNNNKQELVVEDNRGLEIVKAVAQAWYSHSESLKAMNEFDAQKRNFRGNPTRFKVEAMRNKNKPFSCSNNSSATRGSAASSNWTSWDFGQSLWDSYEIVTVSKRLETGLVLDGSFSEISDGNSSVRVHRKRRESKNSLRSLFSQMSNSKRFHDTKVPRESDDL